MTLEQYSTIQRMLGKIEGAAWACPEQAQSAILDALEVLDAIVDGMQQEATDGRP